MERAMPIKSQFPRKSTNRIGITDCLCAVALAFVLAACRPVAPSQATGRTLYVGAPAGLTGTCGSWAKACDLQYALSGVARSGDVL
jgi:hypothetical protein